MHDAIQISKLNDFIFSPKSLYYHSFYESFSKQVYHEKPQIAGTLAHERIDRGNYSSASRYLQGMPIYSSRYNVLGKIDIFDRKTHTLIERKNKVKRIYLGYILQLYAQMFCLEEVGYKVLELKVHSLKDNKSYRVNLPSEQDIMQFEHILEKIRNFNPIRYKEQLHPNKLDNCIYRVFYA